MKAITVFHLVASMVTVTLNRRTAATKGGAMTRFFSAVLVAALIGIFANGSVFAAEKTITEPVTSVTAPSAMSAKPITVVVDKLSYSAAAKRFLAIEGGDTLFLQKLAIDTSMRKKEYFDKTAGNGGGFDQVLDAYGIRNPKLQAALEKFSNFGSVNNQTILDVTGNFDETKVLKATSGFCTPEKCDPLFVSAVTSFVAAAVTEPVATEADVNAVYAKAVINKQKKAPDVVVLLAMAYNLRTGLDHERFAALVGIPTYSSGYKDGVLACVNKLETRCERLWEINNKNDRKEVVYASPVTPFSHWGVSLGLGISGKDNVGGDYDLTLHHQPSVSLTVKGSLYADYLWARGGVRWGQVIPTYSGWNPAGPQTLNLWTGFLGLQGEYLWAVDKFHIGPYAFLDIGAGFTDNGGTGVLSGGGLKLKVSSYVLELGAGYDRFTVKNIDIRTFSGSKSIGVTSGSLAGHAALGLEF